MKDNPEYTNKLIGQKSPYLLQHAHNPVNWYPWSQEAFDIAKAQDKPIFLSIGYATCHWCHVMEKESFENTEIANKLNEAFINIKVDREELPEIDSLYMEFAQGMMTGAAGWPLNVILTPDLQPFFAATYLPPYNSHGMMGVSELTERIQEIWGGEEREAVMMQASQIVEVFADAIHARGLQLPEREDVDAFADLLFRLADPVYGGMKGIPKFPIGYQYNFMLHYGALKNDSRALFLVERTLDMIHRGGIYDHLGGGISRYSVDEQWQIPHFEKMLYDNALLAHTYLEAWRATKKENYAEITKEILDYVLREMRHPQGGFYSAEDADSEGQEGLFYTWKTDEILEVLGDQDGQLFCEFYGVTINGNFEGRNVLRIPVPLEEFAAQRNLNALELKRKLKDMRQQLWKVRSKRVHPFKDDKILSSWNGLMIYALVEAGSAFNHQPYIDSAVEAAQFIKNHLWIDNQLYRRWRENDAQYRAALDEYAFLIRALISLFEADAGAEWLEWAMELTSTLKQHFKVEEGAFYQTDGSDPTIILRKCQFSDGAEPSGNAIHCENLLRLYQLTLEPDYLTQAEDILKGVKKYIDSYAPGYSYHMMNMLRFYDEKAKTYVVVLGRGEKNYEEIRSLIFGEFIPHRSVIWRHEGDQALFKVLPFIERLQPSDGKTTLCICHDGACQLPITDFSQMEKAVRK